MDLDYIRLQFGIRSRSLFFFLKLTYLLVKSKAVNFFISVMLL